MRYIPSVLVVGLLLASVTEARNTRLELPLQSAIERGVAEGILDGSVRFVLSEQAQPAALQAFGSGSSSRKTNAVNKSDEEACEWAMLTVLKAFQQQAKSRGANAVVNFMSNFDRVEFRSADKYECRAGALMAGVAMKGDYARIAP